MKDVTYLLKSEFTFGEPQVLETYYSCHPYHVMFWKQHLSKEAYMNDPDIDLAVINEVLLHQIPILSFKSITPLD
jgi:hypothetical protein